MGIYVELRYQRPKSDYKPSDRLHIDLRYYYKGRRTRIGTGVEVCIKDFSTNLKTGYVKRSDKDHQIKNVQVRSVQVRSRISELERIVSKLELDGLQRSWYRNGKLQMEQTFENGVKVTPPKSVSPPKSTSPCKYNPDVFLSTMKLLPLESVYRGHHIELTSFDKGEKKCVVGYRVCYNNTILCHDVEFTFRWDCDKMENRISSRITGPMFNRTTSITVNQISQFILQDFYPGY